MGSQEIPIACPSCGGYGGFVVTHDMAMDACDPSMEGVWWGCSRCNGSGIIGMQEIE